MKIRIVFVAPFVAFLQFFEIFQRLKIQNAMQEAVKGGKGGIFPPFPSEDYLRTSYGRQRPTPLRGVEYTRGGTVLALSRERMVLALRVRLR